MQHDSFMLILESDQAADTFVQNTLGQTAIARLLSYRCQEAQSQALPCQDYARVVSNRQGSSISFCVCDGVGNSYKGNFAAQYLATCLVDWLQNLTTIPQKSSKGLKALQPRLDQWAHEAQDTLALFDIPEEIPELVREVLEDLRKTYGSETVFLCGRIDAPGQPQFLRLSRAKRPSLFSRAKSHRIQALFFWMGNVTARLFISAEQHIVLGDGHDDSNRWSTVRGRHGPIAMRIFSFDALDRLIVYTDGLESMSGELPDLSDDELQQRAHELLSSPTSDDMTMLDLQWLHGKTPINKRRGRFIEPEEDKS